MPPPREARIPTLPGRRFDLHLHSTRSDGRLSPEALLAACSAGGLDVVALTDHDLASSLPVGQVEVGGRPITVISGAEVSGVHEGVEQHLLVYFRGEPPASFRAFCAERCRERAARYAEGVERLGLPGLPAPDDEAWRGARALTRQHLAEALVARGHARDLREAFRRYVGDAHPTVPPVSLSFVDAIAVSREAGGLTSWAHPSLARVERHLATFAAAGLHGVEAERPGLSGAERRRLRALARGHGLFVTGGSDWHGGAVPVGLFAVDRAALGGFLAAFEAA